MLNGINEKGLSKDNRVKIKSFPGGTTEIILEEVEKQGISQEGYQSRTSLIPLLCMLGPMIWRKGKMCWIMSKKNIKSVKWFSPQTKLVFLSLIVQKDKNDIDKEVLDTNLIS